MPCNYSLDIGMETSGSSVYRLNAKDQNEAAKEKCSASYGMKMVTGKENSSEWVEIALNKDLPMGISYLKVVDSRGCASGAIVKYKRTTESSGSGCTGETGEICYGGYDADPNKKEIPMKVLFLNPVGSTLSENPQVEANLIVERANSQVVYDNHRFLKFANPSIEQAVGPTLTQILNSNYMIGTYGSTEHYVVILVKNLLSNSGGAIGYSSGLRIDWKKKNSIVVFDYDYVINSPRGGQVLVHELLHGMGAPHTTDANGGQDNFFSNGLQVYKNIKMKGALALQDTNMDHDFKIYIEDEPNFTGIRAFGGFNWDTRTLMMWYATDYRLFVDNDSAGNGTISNILSVYYESFVK